LTEGKKKVRVQDIAKVLNISTSTVSRALNDHPRISKETKDKVKLAASRLGFQSGLPQLMNPEKAEAVVVLVPSLESDIYREVLSGAKACLHEQAFQTFIIDTGGDDDQAHAFFQSYKKYGISGILHLIANRKISEDFYALPIKDELPLVTVCEPEATTGLSSVLPDLFQGFFKIAQYLKSLEIQRIALLLEDEDKPEDFQIVSSFTSALETMEMDANALSVNYLGEAGSWPVKEIEFLLSGDEKPQAVLVKGTQMATELMRIAESLGLLIPADLLLIAMGVETALPGPASHLSMLKIPAYEIGYAAAELLLKQIHHPQSGKITEVKPVQFILKGSAIRMK